MMKAYPEYKNSGFEWLGEVPEHWELRRLGTHFFERSEKVNDTDYPALSVTKLGIVPQLENVAKTDANDNRKKVVEGDFVINSRSDRKGSSGISDYNGSVSLISIVLEPRNFSSEYAHHLFRSYNFQEEFYRYGSGIVADLWSTRFTDMKGIYIPVMPLEEQHKIARYLDKETVRIDSLISEKQNFIKLKTIGLSCAYLWTSLFVPTDSQTSPHFQLIRSLICLVTRFTSLKVEPSILPKSLIVDLALKVS